MYKRYSFLIYFLCCAILGHAQKIKVVSASVTYSASEDIPLTQIREVALERARTQAIADEFGTMVSQFNTTRVKNVNGASTVDFLSLGGSEVKGEWIETLEEHCSDPIFGQNMITVTAMVKGRAREIVSSGVDFESKILRNGTDEKFEDSNFKNKDDLYVSFVAPTDGYLTIYLIDAEKQAYCLLPYRHQTEGIYKVKANRHYVFFNVDKAPISETSIVDEYVMTCNSSIEQNLICVVFSPNHFTKSVDKVSDEKLPRNLSIEEFQRWLFKCRKRDKDMCLKQYIISISNE